MGKHSISDSVTFVGEWNLPGRIVTPAIAGTLSWSSHRASLELIDSFTPLKGAIFGGEVRTYPVVHGTTTSSEFVSILQASSAGSGFNFGPAGLRQREKLISSWLVVGAHVASDTRYSEMRLRIPGLQFWIGRGGVRQTILPKTENSAAGVIYQVDGLSEELTAIPTDDAVLGWGIGRVFAGDLVSEISVKTSAYLRIGANKPQQLEWFFAQLTKATTLLSFLAGSPMAPDQISVTLADSDVEADVLVALREAKYCDHEHLHDFFMLRNEMECDLGAAFSKWFELYDSVALPSQLAASVLNSKELWLHVEFLSLMQALEGFHRSTMLGTYTSESEYERIRAALTNCIPKEVSDDHKASLKSRIKFGNEVSLRKRLDGLIQRLPTELREQILGGTGTIPQRWVDTRNYYTHWDPASRENVLDGLGMHRAGVRLRLLLRVLYLDLVGIPASALAKSLRNANSESQYLIQLNSAEYRRQDPNSNAGALMHIDIRDPESPGESQS